MPANWFNKMIASKQRKAKRKAKSLEIIGMGQLRVSQRPTDKQLDSLWGSCIKEAALKVSQMCRMCGARRGNTAYHIVPKQMGHWIRWDLTNGLLSCGPCNGGEVTNRTRYRMRHVEMFGRDFIEKLEMKAVAGGGHKIDRWAVHVLLTQELKRIRGTADGAGNTRAH